MGEVELDELLSHRDRLNLRFQPIIDLRTEPFGVKVVSVEVNQVDLPEQMQCAMAKQAEIDREKCAKIIHAQGEFNAAQKLVARRGTRYLTNYGLSFSAPFIVFKCDLLPRRMQC